MAKYDVTPANQGYKEVTTKRGYKNYDNAMQLMNSIPTDEDFNPYDYIDQANYKMNRRGQAAYQEDLAKLLYLAQINQEERMNEYNSPAEQAQRMREAGMNPDLQGISNEPASNVAGYQGNPMEGISDNLSQVGSVTGIISDVTNVVGSIMSAGSAFLSFPTQQLDKALGVSTSALGFFQAAQDNMQIPDIVDALPTLSHKQRGRLKKAYNSFVNSKGARSLGFKNDTDYYKSQGDYHRYHNDPLYNQGIFEDYEEEYKAYSEVWKPLIDAQNKFALKNLESKSSTADHEKVRNDMWKEMREPVSQVLDNLKQYDNKYPWAVYARSALGAILMHILK